MAVSVDTVRSIAAPIVSAAKLDLEDVTVDRVGRRDKVCVIVDADGGVDLDGSRRSPGISPPRWMVNLRSRMHRSFWKSPVRESTAR